MNFLIVISPSPLTDAVPIVRPQISHRRGRVIKTQGHHNWTDKEIALFERHHPIGSRVRLALALLLYTGQRRSDVIRMGAQHIRNGAFHVQQEKTASLDYARV